MGSSSSSENRPSRQERRASRANRNAPPPGATANTRPPPQAPQQQPSQQQRGAPPQQQRPHGPSVVHQQRGAPPPSHQPPRQQPGGAHQPPMPQHLMQHQHQSFQQRAPAPAAPSNFAAANVSAEVKEAKNVTALCTIHPKKVQIIEDCISFVVTTTVPVCDYEIHCAIRETIRKGEVIFTPNKAKQPPQRITIEGEHDDLELVVPLELDEVSDQEKQYIKEYPKQIPLAIVLRYVHPETGASMCEFTYVQISPKPQVFRQMIQTAEGVFKVESIFGGDDGDHAATAVVASEEGEKKEGENDAADASTAPIIDDDGEDECVICLTNPKDTIVLPCRHLCICKECAERLRKESVKQQCPVCRGPFEQLLHVNK